MPDLLTDGLNLALILFGFGLVIVIHELGHFLAARWAGVRVETFSVGFGDALVSFRPGMGWRRGSTLAEYAARSAAGEDGLSPTEYRLSVVPLGGYVKMLGQDDADPSHRSDAPDSYNSVVVWKRMVIISAGVVFNVISAAALFVIAFSIGLTAAPPELGVVESGSPAALAAPIDSDAVEPGLRRGDVIRRINGRTTRSFNDVFIAVAMSDVRRPVELEVERPEVGLVSFSAEPREGELTQLLELGVAAARSSVLLDPGAKQLNDFQAGVARMGLPSLTPESRLTRVDGRDVDRAGDLVEALTAQRGGEVTVRFETPGGETIEGSIGGVPVLPTANVAGPSGVTVISHLLGFRGVMTVAPIDETSKGWEKGLRTGDVFVRLGDVEYPSIVEGRRAIQAARQQTIEAVVLRRSDEDGSGGDGSGGDSSTERVRLSLEVDAEGRVGFGIAEWDARSTLLAAPLEGTQAADAQPVRGTRVVAVGGRTVDSLADLARELVTASEAADAVTLTLLSPVAGSEPSEVEIAFDEDARQTLATLRWHPKGGGLGLFQPEEIVLRGANPVESAAMGFGETRRVMETTYLTFLRLFQGSIRVEKLSGPIGIVHVGTLFAGRGFAWILFFFGMVSINLAVINFLPVPITDGGHMIFLAWEQVTGRPVSPIVQNIAALAGLAVLGVVFVVVTYNDVLRLLGLSV
ncbi:MAG: site-2 protease family protein [Planctomycetota bacterium]